MILCVFHICVYYLLYMCLYALYMLCIVVYMLYVGLYRFSIGCSSCVCRCYICFYCFIHFFYNFYIVWRLAAGHFRYTTILVISYTTDLYNSSDPGFLVFRATLQRCSFLCALVAYTTEAVNETIKNKFVQAHAQSDRDTQEAGRMLVVSSSTPDADLFCKAVISMVCIGWRQRGSRSGSCATKKQRQRQTTNKQVRVCVCVCVLLSVITCVCVCVCVSAHPAPLRISCVRGVCVALAQSG